MDPYSRTRFLLGDHGMNILRSSHVAVFGLGGVGGYVVEALARSGIGALTLVDHDTVSITNMNRQLLATRDTVGLDKCQAAFERVKSIDPDITVHAIKEFYLPETTGQFDFTKFDYVVDAVDTVTAKLSLIQAAKAAHVPIISCMGTGNKLDPTQFEIADISKTSVCPLARIMRKECAKRGLKHVKVLYSKEDALSPMDQSPEELPEGRRTLPGSVAFVPSVAGLIIAGEVIKDLAGVQKP